MKKKLFQINNILLPLTVVLFLLALVTILDVESAQGVGLYVAMQCGAANRTPFDMLMVVCGMVLLLLVLVLPYKLLGHRGVESLFRLSAAYFAFMPILSLAMLVHLFDGHSLLICQFDWEMCLSHLSNFLREAVLVLFFLSWLYKKEGGILKKWHVILLAVQAVGAVAMLFLPELCGVMMHSVFYLLLLVAYDWWEYLLKKNTILSVKIVSWLIFGVLYGRGCCRMLELMSQYHL